MAHSVTRSGSLKSSLIIWWTFYYLGLSLAFKLATSEALSLMSPVHWLEELDQSEKGYKG